MGAFDFLLQGLATAAEPMMLLYALIGVTLGTAVGVHDAGHIGLESLLVLVPEKVRNKIEILIHLLVGLFGGAMAWG